MNKLIFTVGFIFFSITASAQKVEKFVDHRDGHSYKIVTIGEQTWMAENLNYVTPDSWCYDDSIKNCSKFGRLYTWEAAISACPVSWHLPSEKEWIILEKQLGMTAKEIDIFYYRGDGFGNKLKSESGWENKNNENCDINETSFSALPGGYRIFYDSSFVEMGIRGSWWASTLDGKYAFRRSLFNNKSGIDRDLATTTNAFSIRCIKD